MAWGGNTGPCESLAGRRSTIFLSVLFAGIALSISLAAPPLDAIGSLSADESQPSGLSIPLRSRAPHSTITIDSNAQFSATALSEGWPGDGSAGNPYLINGYEINASGQRAAILIGNTTVHFNISLCTLIDSSEAGITLYNATNGKVYGNSLERNAWYGIYAFASPANSFVSNTLNGSLYGVRLENSDSIFMGHNSIQYVDSGVYLKSSDNLAAEFNNCSLSNYDGDGWALYLNSSSDAIVGNCDLRGVFGALIESSVNITIADSECRGAQSVRVLRSSWINILNNSCSQGIFIDDYCDNCTVKDNDLPNSEIHLRLTVDSLVSGNNADAISSVTLSKRNTIVGNFIDRTYFGGFGGGIVVSDSADHNVIANNTGTKYIIESGSCDFNVIKNNTAVGDSNFLAIRVGGNFNEVSYNNCSNNPFEHHGGQGIYLSTAAYSLVHNNTCTSNAYYGIRITRIASILNTVRDNNCSGNLLGGIVLESKRCTLRNNTMTGDGVVIGVEWSPTAPLVQYWNEHDIDASNTLNGMPVIYVKNGTGGSVTGGAGQLILANCTGMSVEGNSIGGALVGLQIGYSDNNTIRNNNLSGNSYGMWLTASYDNSVLYNAFFNNADYAIWIKSGSRNRIFNNTFVHNHGSGDTYNAGLVQASDDGSGNSWNETNRGNYWADWLFPDSNFDGIVDVPYDLPGTGNALDNFPLSACPVTDPIPEFTAFPLAVGSATLLGLVLVARRRIPLKE